MRDIEIRQMLQKKNFDLWQQFQTKKSDIENTLNEINSIIDIDNYLVIFESILGEVSNDQVISAVNIDNDILQSCIEKLDNLNNRIDNELIPFYNIYKLQKKIHGNLDEKENCIDNAINNSLNLIELLNKVAGFKMIDPHTGNQKKIFDIKDLNDLYEKSIEVLYKVIIYEQIYDRDTIINEIKNNKDNFLIDTKLDKYINEDLRSINKESIYGPLHTATINEIIDKKYINEREEYLNNKANAREDLKKRIFDYQQDVTELEHNSKELKRSIRNIKVDRRINRVKLLSYVLVPAILIGGGFGMGKIFSNQIDEYRTITRTVNPTNQQIVETLSDIYDEKENTYTATVKVYSPWQKRGDSYIRNVYAYNYDPNNLDYESFNVNDSKYHYMEAKEQLDSNDSMEETVVLITETIQDKNDTRKSTKYIIPLSIVGAVLSIIIDSVMGYIMGTYDIKVALNKLKKLLDEKELVKEELLDDAKELYRDGSIIRSDCETISSIYQFSKDEFSELKIIKKTWK